MTAYDWYERDTQPGILWNNDRILRTRTGAWKVNGKRYSTYRLAFHGLFRSMGGFCVG